MNPQPDPVVRVIVVPFTEEEFNLLVERAAAHSASVLDFIRYCSLTQPTPLEGSGLRAAKAEREYRSQPKGEIRDAETIRNDDG
jgi:hypothetical protein